MNNPPRATRNLRTRRIKKAQALRGMATPNNLAAQNPTRTKPVVLTKAVIKAKRARSRTVHLPAAATPRQAIRTIATPRMDQSLATINLQLKNRLSLTISHRAVTRQSPPKRKAPNNQVRRTKNKATRKEAKPLKKQETPAPPQANRNMMVSDSTRSTN